MARIVSFTEDEYQDLMSALDELGVFDVLADEDKTSIVSQDRSRKAPERGDQARSTVLRMIMDVLYFVFYLVVAFLTGLAIGGQVWEMRKRQRENRGRNERHPSSSEP